MNRAHEGGRQIEGGRRIRFAAVGLDHSHAFAQIDQFLWFTGTEQADVVSSIVANYSHPDSPKMQDFGEVMLRSDGAHGYVRVDWYTPRGLPTWGDGRLVILGTEGYIELRKYVDVAGRPGRDHLFVVDDAGTEYIDCSSGSAITATWCAT
jgi:predicted dehydrogenase